jgi:hypothetical protein
MLRSYNGFSGQQRELVGRIINQKVAAGELNKACKCRRCGQTEGIIHYHCEDYSLPVTEEKIEHLCWRCHMMWHSRFRNPESVAEYFAQIAQGKVFPPVRRHDFTILKREHNVT